MLVIAHSIADTRIACRARLRTPALTEIERALLRQGTGAERCAALVAAVDESADSQRPIDQLRAALAAGGVPIADCSLERVLLLHAASRALDRVAQLPVPDSVKALFCEAFQFVAAADGRPAAAFPVGSGRFVGLCKTASLRRFPAGQFDWEVGGIARSDVVRVAPRTLPRALAFVAFRMRGFGPVFFSHLNPRRPSRSLREDEANRSYHRMAQAMAQQPGIKGFAACSWFRSPATHAVSPHLAWLSDVIVGNGGAVFEAGPADPDCGVLHRSVTRKRLYEAGEFTPTNGLVMWPRDAMIAWAARHPEFR